MGQGMRLSAVLAVCVFLPACPEVEDPEPCLAGCTPEVTCEGSNPGCDRDECVTDPADPDYGICGGEIYECDDMIGQWEVVGWCEPFPIDVTGILTIAQSGTVCGVDARAELHLEVDAQDQVTAIEPVEIVEAYLDEQLRDATLDATIVDVWSGAVVTIVYDLYLDWSGAITGTARIASGTCTGELAVTGSYEPAWSP